MFATSHVVSRSRYRKLLHIRPWAIIWSDVYGGAQLDSHLRYTRCRSAMYANQRRTLSARSTGSPSPEGIDGRALRARLATCVVFVGGRGQRVAADRTVECLPAKFMPATMLLVLAYWRLKDLVAFELTAVLVRRDLLVFSLSFSVDVPLTEIGTGTGLRSCAVSAVWTSNSSKSSTSPSSCRSFQSAGATTRLRVRLQASQEITVPPMLMSWLP